MTHKRGYFRTPYGAGQLAFLAKSVDPIDRWEAASALVDTDEATANEVLEILRTDKDPLVVDAIKSFLASSSDEHTPRPGKVGSLPGGYRDAYLQPLGPLKKGRLSAAALSWASKSFHRKNIPGQRPTSFPQANSIEMMMEMLDQILELDAIHGKKIGLVDRQVIYYRDALRYVGLVELTSRAKLRPSDALETLDSSYQKLGFVIKSFLGVKSVGAAYLGIIGRCPDCDDAPPRTALEFHDYFVGSSDSEGLSGSTVLRRAQTGLTWAIQIAGLLGQPLPKLSGGRLQ